MNHDRAVQDYQDRKASAEAGGRLHVGEPPEPMPQPSRTSSKIDLEAALHFPNQYGLATGRQIVEENQALVDRLERHARDEIARLRAEIRAREAGSNT